MATASDSQSTISDKPHQPANFEFPKREFGINSVVRCSFQPSWFKIWTWLHYDEQSDTCYCYLCMKAYKEKKLFQNTIDLSFIAKGFYNWKDATVKFRAHEASKCHNKAVLTIITLPKTTADIVIECRQTRKV